MKGHLLKSKPPEPMFRDLTREQSEALLEKNHVGRIAYSFHDAVDIRPIHYVFAKGWLFGRTSQGDKLVTLRHHQWVAFEIDEVNGPLDWQSVVVHGTFYPLENEGSVHDVQLYESALNAIRKIAPYALTDLDPLAFRTEVFGISIDSITGRSCSTRTTS
jgi:nitroimidazol reductase NimA-like FMN-containing flavoprotein (pyridoxamine 5'-phosphate oxidase superfamily)